MRVYVGITIAGGPRRLIGCSEASRGNRGELTWCPYIRTATWLVIGKEWVQPGRTVITGCWTSYAGLQEEGFGHVTLNQSIAFMDERTRTHRNTVKGT
jgi:hypothetical protein